MRDFLIILDFGIDEPRQVSTYIKAEDWTSASAFAHKAYKASDGWRIVDVIEIIQGMQ